MVADPLSGKASAVKRVTESVLAGISPIGESSQNKGGKTPGVDRIIWKTPEAKANAIASLERRGYAALPLRRMYIPKKHGKKRPLGIPVMKCRAMQATHRLALDPIAETTADLNSYAFRTERSTADAMVQCFIVLARKVSAEWVA